MSSVGVPPQANRIEYIFNSFGSTFYTCLSRAPDKNVKTPPVSANAFGPASLCQERFEAGIHYEGSFHSQPLEEYFDVTLTRVLDYPGHTSGSAHIYAHLPGARPGFYPLVMTLSPTQINLKLGGEPALTALVRRPCAPVIMGPDTGYCAQFIMAVIT